MTTDTPLFPLRTVLFPGGPLPLRIFETRYLDMISRCMREEVPFGVLLITEGKEAGAADTHSTGTLARIVDWYRGSDGLLGITALGMSRFSVVEKSIQDDGLNLGQIVAIDEAPEQQLPAEFGFMADLLKAVIEDLGKLYADLDRRYEDAAWVSYRLSEILPIELEQKQVLLEMQDPVSRLRELQPLLKKVRPQTFQ
jgi:Lon protease-like protein